MPETEKAAARTCMGVVNNNENARSLNGYKLMILSAVDTSGYTLKMTIKSINIC